MVQRDPPALFGVVFEHREVHDPEEVPCGWVDQLKITSQLVAQLAQRPAHHGIGVSSEEHEVADLEAESLLEFISDGRDKLGDAGFVPVFGVLDRGHAAGAEGLDKFAVSIRDLARHLGGAAGHADSLDDAFVLGERILENAKVSLRREVGDVGELQTEACVRPVDTEPIHRLLM